jgi:hypothetical protein
MKEVGRLAKKYSIPLICDEVQTGIGRTGKWWAVEHFGIQPDIITVAKPLRVGATLGKKELFPQEEYRISSTWGEGNASSSAIGYTIIETIQKEACWTTPPASGITSWVNCGDCRKNTPPSWRCGGSASWMRSRSIPGRGGTRSSAALSKGAFCSWAAATR